MPKLTSNSYNKNKLKIKKKTNTRHNIIKKAMYVSVVVNLFLGVLKVIFGILGNSSALISDGIHSLADLFADFFTLIAGKLGSKAPDEDHPYGHKRIETFFNFWLGVALMAIAAFIAWSSISNIYNSKFIKPEALILWVAAISILFNEGLFRFLKKLNKKHGIPIISTNASHARADVYSSLIVFIGILGSVFGISFFDGIATIIVAGFIAKMGIEAVWGCVKELTDTAVSSDMQKKIGSILSEIPDIKDFYNIRTRSMAESVFLDFHILVSDFISVSEGHFIAEKARYNLIKNIKFIEDVVIHIDYCKHDDDSIFLYIPDKKYLSRENLLKLISDELKIKLKSEQLIIDYSDLNNININNKNIDNMSESNNIKLNLKLLLKNKVDNNNLSKLKDRLKSSCKDIEVYISNEF